MSMLRFPVLVGGTLAVSIATRGLRPAMSQSAESGFLYKNLPVATGSVAAGEGNSVLFKGQPCWSGRAPASKSATTSER
ncbi:MAG: hypothetical protein KatS3mg082_1104 [Nitrospiraceae bacterium]|nr:MAG: hypothetical protein KatS3mg082_1104 [Nitrospiraceae bacterium]